MHFSSDLFSSRFWLASPVLVPRSASGPVQQRLSDKSPVGARPLCSVLPPQNINQEPWGEYPYGTEMIIFSFAA